jgi:hypothetical protein
MDHCPTSLFPPKPTGFYFCFFDFLNRSLPPLESTLISAAVKRPPPLQRNAKWCDHQPRDCSLSFPKLTPQYRRPLGDEQELIEPDESTNVKNREDRNISPDDSGIEFVLKARLLKSTWLRNANKRVIFMF